MLIKRNIPIFKILLVTISLLLPYSAIAEKICSGNGEPFRVQEGSEHCILVGEGNKVIHCTISGLNQSARVLITADGFISNSAYRIPSYSIPITHNTQRLTFSGYGMKDAEINFHYYGPFDPSYSYELTCRW